MGLKEPGGLGVIAVLLKKYLQKPPQLNGPLNKCGKKRAGNERPLREKRSKSPERAVS